MKIRVRCGICGRFFDDHQDLVDHIDEKHLKVPKTDSKPSNLWRETDSGH